MSVSITPLPFWLPTAKKVSRPPLTMASLHAVKRAVTLVPTVRTLPNGVPVASLLNLAVKAPHDAHSHGHGAGPRSDLPPRWAGGISTTSTGLVSKSFTTGKISTPSQLHRKFENIADSYLHCQLPTAPHPHFRSRQGRARGS